MWPGKSNGFLKQNEQQILEKMETKAVLFS